MIVFYLDANSGTPPYLQIAQQVKEAMRLGQLQVGDQLPTVREVIEQVVIHPNTVFKAYHELESEGLVASKPGQGTFVIRTPTTVSAASNATLRRSLERWLRSARQSGLDDESIQALFNATFRTMQRLESEEMA
jgi:GntR family transcriptional regulator